MKKPINYIIATIAGIATLLILFTDLTSKLTLILWCGGLVFIVFSAIPQKNLIREVSLSFAIVLITLAGSDLYFRSAAEPRTFQRSYAEDYSATGGSLGRGPSGPGQYPAVSMRDENGQIIYDVVYTIDANGFRKTRGGGDGADTYLFFGGSFTYGEGVGDDETYPARFSEALGFRFSVVNISFHGYGPQHMLRALELGLPDKAITGPVRGIFYLAIGDHMNRAAGLYWWNRHSPRYVLDDQGDLQPAGFHKDYWLVYWLAYLGSQGGLASKLAQAISNLVLPSDDRIELTVSIIKKSALLAKKMYGVELICLLWGQHTVADLEKKLEARGVKVLRVSEFLGNVYSPEFRILPGIEEHPNALAHKTLGEALARYQSAATR